MSDTPASLTVLAESDVSDKKYLWRRVEQTLMTRVCHYELADGTVTWGNIVNNDPSVSPYSGATPTVEAVCLGEVTRYLRSSDDGPELEKLAHLFTCDQCHRTFDSEWTVEEAEQQALDIFGVEAASTTPGMAEVCSDCYEAMGFTP